MILQQYLQKLGLSDKESSLYLAGLQLGPATIAELAKNSQIKRSTIYEIMTDLKEKSLFSETRKGKRKYFVAKEPNNLLLFIKQREEVLEQILPDLEALKNSQSGRPTIRVYEGVDGLKRIYEDMIKKPGKILAMAAPKDQIALTVLDYLQNEWEPRRIKNGIMLKRININYKKGYSDYQRERLPDELEEVYYLPNKKYPFTVGIYIYRSKVAFVSYHEREMIGIVIRSPEINKTIKMMFNLFWNK